MACNICRQDRGEHKPMVLVRCDESSITKAKKREPLCLIDYCVCEDCFGSWRKAFYKRQTMPAALLLILAAVFVALGIVTSVGWGLYVAAAVPLALCLLSLHNILQQTRRNKEDQVRMVFCDFFFQKGGVPKQIIDRMPFNGTVKNVLVESRGPNYYMLMDLDEMESYLTDDEKAPTRSWKKDVAR